MKKLIILISIITVVFTVCSCNKPESETYSGQSEIIEATPIEILSLSSNEIKDIINSYSNFTASDNLYVSVPEKAPVMDYTARASMEQDFENYYEEFKGMFDYLFPSHTLNENYLFYTGNNSDVNYDDNGIKIQDLYKVKDKYDDIMSGVEGRVALLYDETWYRDMTEWKSPVCLEMGSAIGYGYTIINKGKTVELGGKVKNYGGEINSSDTYPCLESYDPADYLERVGSYSPDSTESFKLLDKEVPINEAVAFFRITSTTYRIRKNPTWKPV